MFTVKLPKFLTRQETEGRLELLIDAWTDNLTGELPFTTGLVETVWAANRCLQLVSQQIASMPLRFYGAPSSQEPAWLSSPDPVWFQNGIGDAIFASVWSVYCHGDAFIYVTDEYSDGFAKSWTLLDPQKVTVRQVNGRRAYSVGFGGVQLDPDRVVQISRDPRGGLRGTSVFQSLRQTLWSTATLEPAGRDMIANLPPAVLKSEKRLTEDQANQIKAQFIARAKDGPPVLPPELSLLSTGLAIPPKDLMLLDALQHDARTVAAAFGIPALMLNLPLEGGLNYQTPILVFVKWWREELRPRAVSIANALSANLLPRGSYVAFDAKEVLAPTFKEDVDAWKEIIEFGGASIEEFRADVLKLPPQSNNESLADLSQPTVAATSGQSSSVTPIRPVQESRK